MPASNAAFLRRLGERGGAARVHGVDRRAVFQKRPDDREVTVRGGDLERAAQLDVGAFGE